MIDCLIDLIRFDWIWIWNWFDLIRLDDDDDDDDDDAACMRTYDISCFFRPTSLLQVARAGGHQNGERVLGAEIWPFRLQPSDRCSAAVPWKLIVGSWGSQV